MRESQPCAPALLLSLVAACASSPAGGVGGDAGGGGGRWTLAAGGLPAETVMTLAADASAPATVYAGLGASLVYKTTDGGSTWSQASSGISLPEDTFGAGIFSLAVDHMTPGVVYAGSTWGGAWKTSDGGGTWSLLPVGGSGRRAVVAVDPNDSNRIYVGGHYGLSTTTDGGASWNALLQGTPKNIQWIVVDPHDPATAYSCYDWVAFKISDGTVLTGIGPAGLYAGCGGTVDASGALYMGAWLSSSSTVPSATVLVTHDQGATWSPAATGLPDPSQAGQLVFAADPVQPGVVYLVVGAAIDGDTTAGRVLRTDDGQSWHDITDNLAGAALSAIAVAPSDPQTIYVGTNDGRVYRRSGASP
jgi:hypothetical protein